MDDFAHQQIHLISHLLALIIDFVPDGLAILAIVINSINHLGGGNENNYRQQKAHFEIISPKPFCSINDVIAAATIEGFN